MENEILIVQSSGKKEVAAHARRVRTAVNRRRRKYELLCGDRGVLGDFQILKATTAVALSTLHPEWQKDPGFSEATVSLVITTIIYEVIPPHR